MRLGFLKNRDLRELIHSFCHVRTQGKGGYNMKKEAGPPQTPNSLET
jgi:hypothetical protein